MAWQILAMLLLQLCLTCDAEERSTSEESAQGAFLVTTEPLRNVTQPNQSSACRSWLYYLQEQLAMLILCVHCN